MMVLNGGTITVVTDTETRVEKHPNPSNVHQPLIEDFVTAVLTDRDPAVTGERGREVTRILDKIYGR